MLSSPARQPQSSSNGSKNLSGTSTSQQEATVWPVECETASEHVACMSFTDILRPPEKISVPGDDVDLLKAQIQRLKVELISTSASYEEAQEGLEQACLH